MKAYVEQTKNEIQSTTGYLGSELFSSL